MYSSGDWLSPTLREELRFTKPPLLYWMVVSSYKIFGVSFFSARLPSVFCAVLTVIFIFRLGRLLFNRDAAWLAALLTATSFGMVKFSKIVLMESPLILTLLLAFYYFVRFYRERSNGLLIGCFVWLGITALLKSPIYSAIALTAMVLFLLSEKSLKRLFCKELVSATSIALLIAIPWYIAMVVIHGHLFTDFYMNEHVNKFEAVPHFVLRVWFGLLLYMMPWTSYVFYAAWVIFSRQIYLDWQYKLLLIIMGLFLVVFMIPNQKGLYYAIPLLPYCGLMTGGILAGTFAPGKSWDYLTAAILISAGLVFAVIVFLLDSAVPFTLASCLFLLAAGLVLIRSQSKTIPMILSGVALIPLYTHIFPAINFEIIPVQKTLALIEEKPLYSYKLSPLKFKNALDYKVDELSAPDDVARSLAQGGYIILRAEDYLALKNDLSQHTRQRLEWVRWQRRIPFKKIVNSAIEQRPEDLHESVLLISK